MNALAGLFDIPAKDVDCAIIVFPKGDKTGCAWFGMSPERVAVMLYEVADDVLRQRVPIKGKQN